MSGFAPAKREGCPSMAHLKPLPESWDTVTELKALHRYVIELTGCVEDLQRQLDALQAPERPTKKPAAEPK
jgi:hypothetical protein